MHPDVLKLFPFFLNTHEILLECWISKYFLRITKSRDLCLIIFAVRLLTYITNQTAKPYVVLLKVLSPELKLLSKSNFLSERKTYRKTPSATWIPKWLNNVRLFFELIKKYFLRICKCLHLKNASLMLEVYVS